ncbi:MAG: nuclear transport factor 2 family protein [Alphaproteobacteria bacterium]|nr:nuclear transport factor 2 family protein [Alphaproteobacteria bacterium]
MPNNVEIVKRLYDACMNKDFDTAKALLHSNYTLKDPMMEINSAQELLDMLKDCPSGRMENVDFISEGNKVVGVFDAIAMEPVPSRMRMCSIITIEDGKVRAEEMFYDTAKIPQEVKDLMQKNMPGKKKAA